MTSELKVVSTVDEWNAYHAIREQVLWAARGRSGYDRAHPDDAKEANVPMLLVIDSHPTGVVRVDIEPPLAWFRLVAIREDRQRRGYGQAMLNLATDFAASRGCSRIRSNVDPAAVGFYEELGFNQLDAGCGESVPMVKVL